MFLLHASNFHTAATNAALGTEAMKKRERFMSHISKWNFEQRLLRPELA